MTKRNFDLVIIMLLLWQPAKGLGKMAASRWSTKTGWQGTVGEAGLVVL